MKQFNHHYEISKIALHHQSVYCEHHSCETTLTKVMDDILWKTEQRKATFLVCIDLSAAFDIVDHSFLINVLNNYHEISGSALQWFELYLADRSVKVSICDVCSETKRLSFSVPQGSCGSSVLYCAYASVISEIIPNLINLNAFTDDHAISDSFNTSIANSELNSVTKLSGCLDNVGSWRDFSRLKMNAKKTMVIYIGSRKQLDKCESKEIHVRSDLIPRSLLIKYLGVVIDEFFTFQHHVSMKCKTAVVTL